MHKLLNKSSTSSIIIILMALGIVLRFYNLNWGAPFYFHPDERNIASSIVGLQFASQMDPHFFAYGSLPIYLVYFSSLVLNFFTSCHLSWTNCTQVNFTQAILGLRIIAAISSLILIPLSFLLGKYIKNAWTGVLSAILTTFSVGFIQFAHFGTYEMWLTLFSTLMFGSALWYYRTNKFLPFVLMILTTAILCASKVTSFVLLPIPILLIIKSSIQDFAQHKTNFSRLFHVLFVLLKVFIFLFIVADIYILTNPYTFLDKVSFLNSMHYESGVALGTQPVFYTGEFYNTAPIIFQLLHVFPFLINPLLTIFFVFSFFYTCFVIFKFYLSNSFPRLKSTSEKNKQVTFDLFLLVFFFLLIFLSQAFFFVKWTRYMVPTLPFIYLMISFTLIKLYENAKKKLTIKLVNSSYILAILYTIIFALSFLISAYIETDTRLQALQAARNVLSSNTKILSEVYDLGIVPFNSYFSNIRLYNFYDLDNPSDQTNPNTLHSALSQSQAIILPSQRIMKVRLDNEKQFPQGHNFYTQLLSDKLNFKVVYETPCDIFCQITYLGNPVFSYEETASVFDRPTIFIFRRTK